MRILWCSHNSAVPDTLSFAKCLCNDVWLRYKTAGRQIRFIIHDMNFSRKAVGRALDTDFNTLSSNGFT